MYVILSIDALDYVISIFFLTKIIFGFSFNLWTPELLVQYLKGDIFL